MNQPKGFEVSQGGNKELVCLLNKSLYGLKQSPRQWYKRFDLHIRSHGYLRSSYDACVYYKEYNDGDYVYLLLYVDDMLIACKDPIQIRATKDMLKREFDMKELGEAKKILGIEITRDRGSGIMKLTQKAYLKKVLERFSMKQAKPVATALAQHFKLSLADGPKGVADVNRMSKIPYASAVGSLMYLMVCTRPDLAHAVSIVSRYIASPGEKHWQAVKWVLKYLRGTSDYGLLFGRCDEVESNICGYVDSDFAKDPDKGRSLTGYIFKVMGCTVSWRSTLQRVVALSTTESEYMALTEAVKEAIWLRGMLEELGISNSPGVVYCDNQGAIQLSKNPVYHERTKHINVRLHFIREVIEDGDVEVEKIDTLKNPADALTKALPREKFQYCREKMDVLECVDAG